MAKNRKIKFNFTIFIYLFIFIALVSIMFIVSRGVLFRPWTARTFSASAMIENHVFLFGGVDDDGVSRDEIMMIDMEKHSLDRPGHLPQPVYSASAAVCNGMIFIAGGLSGKQYQDAIYRFDPVAEEVELLGKLPGKRAFGAMSALGDYLYYTGGFDGNTLRSEIIKINCKTGEAAVSAELPLPLEYHRTITLDSLIYILGGEGEKGLNSLSVFAYSPADDRLIKMKELQEPIVRFGLTEINSNAGREVIVSGQRGRERMNSIVNFNFTDGAYTEAFLGTLSESFSDVEIVSFDDNLYLIGGSNPSFMRQLRMVEVDPQSLEHKDVKLKSWAWR